MTRLRFIVIDGKRYLWRDILQLRREQRRAHAAAQQPALFELRHDRQVTTATGFVSCPMGYSRSWI